MVHNGIEYGMLQAYGEGFEIIKKSQYNVDLHKLAATWNHGSVVRSWLLELAERAFAEEADLRRHPRLRGGLGEGRWTVQEAINEDVPAPVITLSLLARFDSRQDESYSAKVIAALRNEFGGHAVKLESGESSGVSFSPDAARRAFDDCRLTRQTGRGASAIAARPAARHGAAAHLIREPCRPPRQPAARGAAPATDAGAVHMVIFGATGDLTMRKLVPALYNLALEGLLPHRLHAGRRGAPAQDRRASSASEMLRRGQRVLAQPPGPAAGVGHLRPGHLLYARASSTTRQATSSSRRSWMQLDKERGTRRQPHLLPGHAARVLPAHRR